MPEISAGLVKELRDLTGLPMMECKKALTETNGDLKKAEELLRIKGSAKASKAAARIAAEGVVGTFVSGDDKLGALVELNCETDFVAKNENFLAFANSLAETVATQNPTDVAQLSAGKIEERRQHLVQKIGENITIRRLHRLQAKGRIAQYLHSTKKIGVLVDYEGPEVTVGFNAKYFLDVLGAIDSDEIILGVSGELDPAVLRPAGETAQESYLAVIMPMRI